MVHRDAYLKVVGIGGTLRENSTSLGELLVDLVQEIEVYGRVGAVA